MGEADTRGTPRSGSLNRATAVIVAAGLAVTGFACSSTGQTDSGSSAKAATESEGQGVEEVAAHDADLPPGLDNAFSIPAPIVVVGEVVSVGEPRRVSVPASQVVEGRDAEGMPPIEYVYRPVTLSVSSTVRADEKTTVPAEIVLRDLGGEADGLRYVYNDSADLDPNLQPGSKVLALLNDPVEVDGSVAYTIARVYSIDEADTVIDPAGKNRSLVEVESFLASKTAPPISAVDAPTGTAKPNQ